MKPLELTWYGAFRDDGNGVRTFHGPDKRLTDAELAAEYHAWDSLCRREQWIEAVRDDYSDEELAGQDRLYERLNTVHRFATLPHYDDEAES